MSGTGLKNRQMIIVLGETAMKHLVLAAEASEKGDSNSQGENVRKAVEIIGELHSAVDTSVGTEGALNLQKLYRFMQEQLIIAEEKNDMLSVREIAGLLGELNRSWGALTC